MFSIHCAVWNSEKIILLKSENANWNNINKILSNLNLKTPFTKIPAPTLGNILLWSHKNVLNILPENI